MSDRNKEIAEQYEHRRGAVLIPLASAVSNLLEEYLRDEPRIDRISARAKATDRFLGKALKEVDGELKYTEPFEQIQDQVGARVVTFYLSDVERISNVVERYFRRIEQRTLVPEREWEFGYFGKHYVLLTPPDLIDKSWDENLIPRCFELQIKTLFQHAWSEAEHDIGYKPNGQDLEAEKKRLLAYTSAQAWGADRVFEELSNAGV